MTKETITLIYKIINITKKIFKLYNILFNLELNNKKNSNSYKQNLKYLDLLIELEDDLYKNITIKDISEYNIYFHKLYLAEKHSNFEIIINDDEELFIYKRISNNLHAIKLSNAINLYQLNDSYIENQFDITTMLTKEINVDMLKAFIYETNKMINKIDNTKNFQDGLIMIKYLVSFLNKDIENKFKSNFLVPNTLYLTNKLILDMYDLDKKTYEEKIRNYYYLNINKVLKNYKNLNNLDYSTKDFRLILISSLINAFNNVCPENIFIKQKMYDIINKSNIDLSLIKQDKNVILLRTERLKLNGISK